MTNPYQSPHSVSTPLPELKKRTGPIIKTFGVLAVILGVLGTGYGILIMGMVVFTWDSISTTQVTPAVVLCLGVLIASFGVGLCLGGLGLWTGKHRWTNIGGLTSASAFALYVAIVVSMI